MVRKKSDVLDELSRFQKDVIDKKPSLKKMTDDVRMMRFKVRPLQGDITLLNVKNSHFIEILWQLGKLDEFYNRKMKKLSGKQKEMVFPFFDGMYQKFQKDLNALNLKHEKITELPGFEVEIYKDRPIKPN